MMTTETTTYSNRSNAARAARAACAAAGISQPLSGVHFTVDKAGDDFGFTLIDVKTGETTRSFSPTADASAAFDAQESTTRPTARKAASPRLPGPPVGGTRYDPADGADAAEAARPAKAARAKKAKSLGKRAQVEVDAAAGKLPPLPSFGGQDKARYAKQVEELSALTAKKDIKGLNALEIPTYSSCRRAMAKYRDLAVLALQAQAAKKAAK